MKIASIALVLAVLASPSMAEARTPCETISGLAGTIMEARQSGVPMAKLMEHAAKAGTLNARRTAEGLIMTAYGQPRYQTPSIVQREIEDFRDEAHLACLRKGSD